MVTYRLQFPDPDAALDFLDSVGGFEEVGPVFRLGDLDTSDLGVVFIDWPQGEADLLGKVLPFSGTLAPSPLGRLSG